MGWIKQILILLFVAPVAIAPVALASAERTLDQQWVRDSIAQDVARCEFLNDRGLDYRIWLHQVQPDRMDLWQRAAESGNFDGMWLVGACYRWGIGVEPSDQAFATVVSPAASQGDARVIALLASRLRHAEAFAPPGQITDGFLEAAGAGHTTAMVNLALRYESGIDGQRNPKMAQRWMKRAADAGNPLALFNLGTWYRDGLVVDQDLNRAVDLLRQSGQEGCPLAAAALIELADAHPDLIDAAERKTWQQTLEHLRSRKAVIDLGWLYESDDREDVARAAALGDPEALFLEGWRAAGRKDWPACLNQLRISADRGLSSAMNDVGFFLTESAPAAYQDPAEGLVWTRRAIAAGRADSMNNLGWFYQQGLGVEKDETEAIVWFRDAAKAGVSLAMVNLGFAYHEGIGVTRDYPTAFDWFTQAAEAGEDRAMLNLGAMYANGEGVAPDDAQAVAWYQKAADAGNADAMRQLAIHYRDGRGVKADLEKAAALYEQSANGGNARSMLDAARVFERRLDPAKARAWAEKARDAGVEGADDMLAAMDRQELYANLLKIAGPLMGLCLLAWIVERCRRPARDLRDPMA